MYPTIDTTQALQNLYKPSRSYLPVPVSSTEKTAGLSLKHWHCLLPMQNVYNLGDLNDPPKAHICLICQHRQYPPLMK